MLKRALIVFSLLLSGCSLLAGHPYPPPPPGDHAIEITREQSYLLEKTGSLSVTVDGNIDEVGREIQRQADARGEQYYRIVSQTEGERVRRGVWHAYAVFYRATPASLRR
ncbi:biofilm peroxide resistance protein BsmA [Musicola paradisiaca]|uniref:YdgH/BhsA/McbA-like domain-containing protein n=1 Tax=Musicola paradisiaca (strain Ech703) TaxID=579405 RepID=C6CAC7_MUSP7|nr:biofilm peroxide resistance protein BsmA [Musicola paradisiaca]ACS84602.1 protein of unknown function DUF1471 [Musicola paradisiaca Ech703]